MSRRRLLATLSFAHLIGNHASKGAEDDTDEKEGSRAEEDDTDDTDEKDGKKGKKARRADEGGDEDDDDKDARADEDGDDEDDQPSSKKGKKARRADEDDGDEADAEDDRDEDAKAARGRERTRCAAIFASKAAGKRPDMAAHFAFNTNLSRRAAINALEATVAGMPELKPQGLDGRMADFGGYRSSAEPPRQTNQQAISASWDVAAKTAGVRR